MLNQKGTKWVAVTNAQYAVFDSLTADRVTLTLDTVESAGGGAGLSGFQIIGDVDVNYSYGAAEEPDYLWALSYIMIFLTIHM